MKMKNTLIITKEKGKTWRMVDDETKCMNSPSAGSSIPGGVLIVSFVVPFDLHSLSN